MENSYSNVVRRWRSKKKKTRFVKVLTKAELEKESHNMKREEKKRCRKMWER